MGWLAIRAHSWLNRFLRLPVRWEKKAANYEATLHFACATIVAGRTGLFGLALNTVCQPRDVQCFDLWFTGVGGARIYAKYLRPKNGEPHPAVLQFHAYSADSGDWTDKLHRVLEGFSVAAIDCRSATTIISRRRIAS